MFLARIQTAAAAAAVILARHTVAAFVGAAPARVFVPEQCGYVNNNNNNNVDSHGCNGVMTAGALSLVGCSGGGGSRRGSSSSSSSFCSQQPPPAPSFCGWRHSSDQQAKGHQRMARLGIRRSGGAAGRGLLSMQASGRGGGGKGESVRNRILGTVVRKALRHLPAASARVVTGSVDPLCVVLPS